MGNVSLDTLHQPDPVKGEPSRPAARDALQALLAFSAPVSYTHLLRTSFTFHLLSRILRFFVYNRVSLEGLLWFSGARLLASPNFDAIRYDEALWRFTSSLALADL